MMVMMMMTTAKMQSHHLYFNDTQLHCLSTVNWPCCPRSNAKICIAPSSASNLKLRCGLSRISVLRVRANLEENVISSAPGVKTVKVKFVLHRKCEFGQYFSVVGDDEFLGAWNPEASLPMEWSDGEIWTSELELSVGRRIEFKILLSGNKGVIEWQPGPNRVFEASKSLPSSMIFETWSSEGCILHDDTPSLHTLDLENESLHTLDLENERSVENDNTPVQTLDVENASYSDNGSLLIADHKDTDLLSEWIISDALNDMNEVINVNPAFEVKDVNEEEVNNEINVSDKPDQLNFQDTCNSKNQRRIRRTPSVLEKDLEWGRQMLSRLWGGLIQNPEDPA